MKKLLVLGSDYFTLAVVQEAHRMGLYVVVTDLMETSPTKEAADEAWMISTTDIDALEKKCTETGINAIMYGASDFNVENARVLCKRLGLPLYCSNDNAWETSRDKYRFKQACRKNGVRVAEDYFLTDDLTEEQLAVVQYPVVVKPIDKSGNRGISFCNNKEELIKGYKTARQISKKRIIVEQRLCGTEHNICYAAANGELKLASYSQTYHLPGEATNLYSFEITTNNHLKQFIKEVNENLISTFKDIGCDEGIVWVDAMWNEEDEQFYILEMGYRFPAALASSVMHEAINGYNPVKWMIETSIGVAHKASDLPTGIEKPYQECVGLVHLFTRHEGVIKQVVGLSKVKKLHNVFVDMPKKEGDKVRGLTCISLISISGKTPEEICETAASINSMLSIQGEDGCELVFKYDEFESVILDFKQGH